MKNVDYWPMYEWRISSQYLYAKAHVQIFVVCVYGLLNNIIPITIIIRKVRLGATKLGKGKQKDAVRWEIVQKSNAL